MQKERRGGQESHPLCEELRSASQLLTPLVNSTPQWPGWWVSMAPLTNLPTLLITPCSADNSSWQALRPNLLLPLFLSGLALIGTICHPTSLQARGSEGRADSPGVTVWCLHQVVPRRGFCDWGWGAQSSTAHSPPPPQLARLRADPPLHLPRLSPPSPSRGSELGQEGGAPGRGVSLNLNQHVFCRLDGEVLCFEPAVLRAYSSSPCSWITLTWCWESTPSVAYKANS